MDRNPSLLHVLDAVTPSDLHTDMTDASRAHSVTLHVFTASCVNNSGHVVHTLMCEQYRSFGTYPHGE